MWRRFKNWFLQFSVENWLAIIAILIATPPFIDWIATMARQAHLVLRPPPIVDLRGTPSANAEGGIDEVGSLASPLALIMTIAYYNTGDPGDHIWVDREIVTLLGPDGSVLARTRGYYDTEVVQGASTWFGNITPWTPRVVPGGAYRANEVVFVQETSEPFRFQDFLDVVDEAEPGASLTIRMEVETLSTTPFQVECTLSISDLASRDGGAAGSAGYYRRQAGCRGGG